MHNSERFLSFRIEPQFLSHSISVMLLNNSVAFRVKVYESQFKQCGISHIFSITAINSNNANNNNNDNALKRRDSGAGVFS